MTPQKISHLSLAFAAAATGLLLALGAYVMQQLEDITSAVQQRERVAAQQEVAEALVTLGQEIGTAGRRLAAWDETRQQLVFDEYYVLWRDSRVRDAGFLSDTIDTVALYDKHGRILRTAPDVHWMPEQLPAPGPVFVVMADHSEADRHTHLYFFLPVFADPQEAVLMGYLGMKFDLLGELERARPFRFAQMRGVSLVDGQTRVDDLREILGDIRYQLRPNPALGLVQQVLETNMVRLFVFVVLILVLAWILLYWLMVRPLHAISREIDALQATSAGVSEPSSLSTTQMPVAELERVRRSFINYRSRLSELHDSLEQSSRDFYQQARLDALTGTYNRRALEEDWQQAADQAADPGPCALMLFDCDHFKAINDTYGHDVGDSVIKAIADCLQRSLRGGDRLYRIGGDEFATCLPGSDRETATQVAQRCLEQLQGHDFKQYGLPEPVSVSIGLAVGDGEQRPGSLSELQKRADLAMYEAKRPGSSKIVFYHEDLGEVASLVTNRTLQAVFEAIHEPGLFEMHYQPMMRLPEHRAEFAEALARIRVDGQLFLPSDIFPIVHTRRLDTEFDRAIIQAIGRDLQSGRLGATEGVSINVSAPGIVHSKVIAALVELKQLEQQRQIVVEITETALITQMAVASNHVRQLREAGFLVALDDFGSGYSSLRYLSSMPVDIVKFDISMIRFLEHEQPHQRAITEEIAAIVKAAGYMTVAEGIETEDMLERVTAIGFDYAQGFYFGAVG